MLILIGSTLQAFRPGCYGLHSCRHYPDIFAAVAFLRSGFKAAISMSEGLAAMKRGGPDPVRQGQLAFEAMRTGLRRKDKRTCR